MMTDRLSRRIVAGTSVVGVSAASAYAQVRRDDKAHGARSRRMPAADWPFNQGHVRADQSLNGRTPAGHARGFSCSRPDAARQQVLIAETMLVVRTDDRVPAREVAAIASALSVKCELLVHRGSNGPVRSTAVDSGYGGIVNLAGVGTTAIAAACQARIAVDAAVATPSARRRERDACLARGKVATPIKPAVSALDIACKGNGPARALTRSTSVAVRGGKLGPAFVRAKGDAIVPTIAIAR